MRTGSLAMMFRKPPVKRIPRTRTGKGGGTRQLSSRGANKPPAPNTKNAAVRDESHLNWKDRTEAPKWMQRIAPPKGGTQPPNKQEIALTAAVMSAGYYAWFVAEPPRAAPAKKQSNIGSTSS